MGDNNSSDSQDIIQEFNDIYNSFVTEVKSYRSQTTVETLAGLSKIDDNTILINTSPATIEPQESYCNCFYRLLGLPVISSSGLYSPGYSPDMQLKDKRTSRFNIANEIIRTDKGFTEVGNLLLEREKFPQSQIAIFQQKNQNSSALALAGAVKLLSPFNLINKSIPPFDSDYQLSPRVNALRSPA